MTIQHPNKTTEALLEEAKELGHHASSDETMHEALVAYIRLKRIEKLIDAASEDYKEPVLHP